MSQTLNTLLAVEAATWLGIHESTSIARREEHAVFDRIADREECWDMAFIRMCIERVQKRNNRPSQIDFGTTVKQVWDKSEGPQKLLTARIGAIPVWKINGIYRAGVVFACLTPSRFVSIEADTMGADADGKQAVIPGIWARNRAATFGESDDGRELVGYLEAFNPSPL